jgi:hypothetical protein
MKGNYKLLKNEKFFEKSKMDKKNVQNGIAEKLLTEKKNRLDKKFLSSQIKPNSFFCRAQNFIFFAEKYLGIFSLAI